MTIESAIAARQELTAPSPASAIAGAGEPVATTYSPYLVQRYGESGLLITPWTKFKRVKETFERYWAPSSVTGLRSMKEF